MKITWHSNAPWVGSGYGQQTGLFAPRIRELGHEIAISAFYGLNGAKLGWKGIDVYPGYADVWGNDVLTAHALHFFQGDYASHWIITLCDVWVLQSPALDKFHVASWVPVDHMPVPPAVYAYFQRSGAIPIAMSRFGEHELRRIGLDPLYVPHGVDRSVIHPIDRKLARQAIEAPEDAFVVGIVAANKGVAPPRKAFGQSFQAFGELARRRKDAVLYVHSERDGVIEGIDLRNLAAACGIPDEQILWVDQYQYRLGLPDAYMAAAYSAMDVLLNPSYGEGFGIPIIEAQACGTPVIVSNFSSMPELVGAGWTVNGQGYWDPRQNAWLHDPSVGEIVRALDKAYKARGSEKVRRLALDKAAEYDADRVASDFWKPTLERLEELSAAAPAALVPLAAVPALAEA